MDALVVGECDEILPVGDDLLFPLIALDLDAFRRPVGNDPVRVLVAGAAGQTRHHHHAVDLEKAGEPDRLFGDGVVFGTLRAGMQRIAGAVECRNRHPVIADGGDEIAPCGDAVEKPVEVDMRCRRPVAATEFQRLQTELGRGSQHLRKRQRAEAVGDHSNLHVNIPSIRDQKTTGSNLPDLADLSAASQRIIALRPSSAPTSGALPLSMQSRKWSSSAA